MWCLLVSPRGSRPWLSGVWHRYRALTQLGAGAGAAGVGRRQEERNREDAEAHPGAAVRYRSQRGVGAVETTETVSKGARAGGNEVASAFHQQRSVV